MLVGGIAVAWLVIPRLHGFSPGQLWHTSSPPSQDGQVTGPITLPPAKVQKGFRVVVWDVTPLDRVKVAETGIVQAIATVVRQFDMAVLIGVDLRDRAVLARLMDEVRGESQVYHYVTVPEPLRSAIARGSVIIFDMRALEVDRRTVQVIEDPQRRFHTPPLTAAFRARGVPPEEAFTFSVLGVRIDPFSVDEELDLMNEVFRAVRDDGRGEDDVIVAGSFAVGERVLRAALRNPDAACVNADLPTNVSGTESSINIAFDARATVEYTGRHGVLDLMRQFRLTSAQVQHVAPHLPVWAEFSVYEGGSP